MKNRTRAVVNANILVGGEILSNRYLLLNREEIVKIGPMAELTEGWEDAIDADGGYLSAAYIDMHTHGACQYDAMDATKEALDAICRFQFCHGVGTFLPTTLTAPLDQVQPLLDLLDSYAPPVAVELPGVHMEGPFLSAQNRGAQPEEYLLTPTRESMGFLEKNKGHIKLITVSPDVENICGLIAWCKENGIVVSGGHDNAIDDEVRAAQQAGMTGVTHIYCCSSSISRRPGDRRKHMGITQCGLLDDSLYVEAIADNCHLPPELLQLIYRAKGWQGICLVSDSIRAAGMEPGDYMLGDSVKGVPVRVTREVAMLQGQNLFAGSITPVGKMVQNAVMNAKIPLAHAAAMATENPARVLGLTRKGRVAEGYEPRLNLLSREGELLGSMVGTHYYDWKEEDITV